MKLSEYLQGIFETMNREMYKDIIEETERDFVENREEWDEIDAKLEALSGEITEHAII